MQDEDRTLEQNEQILKEATELGLIESEVKSEESTQPQERIFTEVEKEQMELGWDPNKTGPTAVSAEEFKRVGQIIEAKRAASKRAEAASKEVKELTMTVKQLVEHNRKLQATQVAKDLKAVEDAREERILQGDIEGVKKLDLEQQVLQKLNEEVSKPVTQPVQEELSKEAQEYVERNKFWLYGQSVEDKKMQILTNSVIDYLKQAEPNINEVDAIKTIESELKSKFPHRFENENKEKPGLVMKSTSKQSTSGSSLSSDEKSAFLKIQKADPSYTVKEYIELLESIGSR